MNYVKLAAAVTVAAVLGVAGQAVLAQKAPASGSDYQVGDRLAPGAAPVSATSPGTTSSRPTGSRRSCSPTSSSTTCRTTIRASRRS